MALKPPKPSKARRNQRKQEQRQQPVRQQLGEAWPSPALPKTLPHGLRHRAKG